MKKQLPTAVGNIRESMEFLAWDSDLIIELRPAVLESIFNFAATE